MCVSHVLPDFVLTLIAISADNFASRLTLGCELAGSDAHVGALPKKARPSRVKLRSRDVGKRKTEGRTWKVN